VRWPDMSDSKAAATKTISGEQIFQIWNDVVEEVADSYYPEYTLERRSGRDRRRTNYGRIRSIFVRDQAIIYAKIMDRLVKLGVLEPGEISTLSLPRDD
jgi:hypothetical protein